MAAGLGFKDFTTGEVLTAADVDGYLMQGVWVFASAAARDAAVTSPQEGNFAFLKDTNTTTYYTGSAWTNLVAASSPGLTFISTTTIGSAVSSISLPASTFTSSYDSYRVIFDCSETTALSDCDISFRLRTGSTDASGANYNYQGWVANTSLAVATASSATSQFTGKTLNATPTRFATVIDIQGIALAKETKYQIFNVGMNGGTNQSYGMHGWHGVATSYDSMSFILSTGSITNGRIRVYGYQNS